MASSELGTRPARGTMLRGTAGIVALYAALALVVVYLTRLPEPGAPSTEPGELADERSGPPGTGTLPSPVPVPSPAYPPAEILAAPAAIQQEPVVPLPADPEDRAEALSDVRKQRVAEMLEQRERRGERARAHR